MSDIKSLPFIVIDLFSGGYYRKHGDGHEHYNLEPNQKDGLYYGYCPPFGGIGIEDLGAKRGDEHVDNVLVIYTQKIGKGPDREVIAFTDHATVYRKPQSGEGKGRQIVIDGEIVDCGYHIVSENLYDLRDYPEKFRILCRGERSLIFRKQRFFKNHYKDIDRALTAWITDYLVRVNIDGPDFYKQVIDSVADVKDLSNTSSREPEYLDSPSGRLVKKNALVSRKAVSASGYKCTFDPAHHTFQTTKGVQYVEGHHLIPCTPTNSEKYWKRFGKNIDCSANIVALCPTCHRRIHFASPEEREGIIRKLYEVQSGKLEAIGLKISLEELKGLYDNE